MRKVVNIGLMLLLSHYLILASADEFLSGDVAPRQNIDGSFNIADVLIANRLILGIEEPTELERLVLDVAPLGDPDGVLNAGDLVVLQRAMLGHVELPNIIVNRPLVTIMSPANNFITADELISVYGTVDKQANIELNSITVAQNSDLTFSYDLNLVEGLNSFTVSATDVYGLMGSSNLVVYKNAYHTTNINYSLIAITNNSDTLSIEGQAGSAESNSTVYVAVNDNVYTAMANSDGSFTLTALVNSGDVVEIYQSDVSSIDSVRAQYVVGDDVQIYSPLDDYVTEMSRTSVVGEIPDNGIINHGVTVNGKKSCIYDDMYYLAGYPLSSGVNQLDVVYNQRSGVTSTKSISITRNNNNNLFLGANIYCGVTPLEVEFNYEYDSSVSDLHIDFNDDGIIDYRASSEGSLPVYTYSMPGVHMVNAWFIGADGSQRHTDLPVVVYDTDVVDSMYQTIWSRVVGGLNDNNRDLALSFLSQESHGIYAPLFDLMLSHNPLYLNDMTPPERVSVGSDIAKFVSVRKDGAVNSTFIINYKRNNNGIWYIDSF